MTAADFESKLHPFFTGNQIEKLKAAATYQQFNAPDYIDIDVIYNHICEDIQDILDNALNDNMTSCCIDFYNTFDIELSAEQIRELLYQFTVEW